MIRKAFNMALRPGFQEEYRRRHNPIWPELQETLEEHGAANYSIFLDSYSDTLFAYVELESEERWNAVAATEVCKRWWQSMCDLMLTNSDDSPLTKELSEVFHMD